MNYVTDDRRLFPASSAFQGSGNAVSYVIFVAIVTSEEPGLNRIYSNAGKSTGMKQPVHLLCHWNSGFIHRGCFCLLCYEKCIHESVSEVRNLNIAVSNKSYITHCRQTEGSLKKGTEYISDVILQGTCKCEFLFNRPNTKLHLFDWRTISNSKVQFHYN